ncbi:MAG: class I SAM-dependent methyltransferase [Crocinitomicaceae bacterium]
MQSKLSKKELNDIIQWDVKTWSKALPFWEEHADLQPGKKVLAIGEREGGLSLWLAKKGLEVYCTDYNEFPEHTKQMHQKYGVQDQIAYHQPVDATNLSKYPDNHFDIVVFKSVIGALSEKSRQAKAIEEMHRVLKEGGQLLFAENMVGSALHVRLRKKFVKWDKYWRYLRYKEDQDLFDKFSEKNFTTKGFLANFGRSERQRSVLGNIDKALIWGIPRSWRYVLIGVLTK